MNENDFQLTKDFEGKEQLMGDIKSIINGTSTDLELGNFIQYINTTLSKEASPSPEGLYQEQDKVMSDDDGDGEGVVVVMLV